MSTKSSRSGTRTTTKTKNSNSSSSSKQNGNISSETISVKSSLLSYQYRGSVEIPSKWNSTRLSVKDLKTTHQTTRLGLGTPLNNLKPQHFVNSKKQSGINIPIKKNQIPGYTLAQQNSKVIMRTPKATTTPGGDSESCITSRMKMLTIYESPKSSSKDYSFAVNGQKSSTTESKLDVPITVFEKTFHVIDKKANMLSLGQKVSYNLGNGEKLVVLPKPMSAVDNNNNQAISSLCRHFRNLLGWKMSLHCNWNYIEEKCKLWPNNIPMLSLEEIASILKISVDNVRMLRFSADLEIIFDVLRKSLCHVNLPNIARMLALSKIQEGKPELAGRFLSECNGMFLHSEIVDKHLTFIRRQEEAIPDIKESSEEKKCEMYWTQVNQTLDFSNDSFDVNGERNFKNMTNFDPDWNIVQITTSVQSSNRFGYEIVGTRKVPQLFLSFFGHLPKRARKQDRCHFTTCCSKPKIEPASLMRHGLIHEFEKLLDKNLMISDDKIIISRKKYWEERARHNEVIQSIMEAMQDWIDPWVFLLPGTIADSKVQDMIAQEILSTPLLRTLTDTQKFLIYRLTENYNTLSLVFQSVLQTFVAFILQIDENCVESLVLKIRDIGSSIELDLRRNPTILVLDQDVEILPWDWLPCLRKTSVSRMPSLNSIRSTQALWSVMNGDGDYRRTIDPSKCTFILNPDGSLPQVQNRLEQYFRNREDWTDVVARSPTSTEMQTALENKDLLVYCGHGAGANFYPEYAIQKLLCRAIPILMGCSSAQCHFAGPRLYGNSYVHAYLMAGCSSVVGFLWEVTDTECDRITVELLERWIPNENAKPPKMPMFDSESTRPVDKNLIDALRKSRTAATQLVTQCAAVCYGLPIVRSK